MALIHGTIRVMKKLLAPAIAAFALFLVYSGCGGPAAAKGTPVIYDLSADTPRVYPHTTAELKCVALDPDEEDLTYKWTSTEGAISGNGPIVSWKAPDTYGDYHIMVLVEDINGNSASATVTIDVVPNPNAGGCKSCGN